MRAAAALTLLLLAACGQGPTAQASPSPIAPAAASPSPAVSPVPTPAAALAVVVQDPEGLAVVNVTGGLRWKAPADPSLTVMGGTPDRLLVYDLGGRVYEVTASGRRQVGSLDGQLQRGLASPDGKRWAWTTRDSYPDKGAATTLHVGGEGIAARTLLTNLEDRYFLEPWDWTSAGILVPHNVSGLGGRYAFGFTTGVVDLVDPDTGKPLRLTAPDKCYVEAVASDGSYACVGQEGGFSQYGSITVLRSGAQVARAQLPKPAYAAAGNLGFSPDGSKLYIGADNFDGTNDHYLTGVLDVRSATLTTLLEGYAPALPFGHSLLPDGSLLLARTLQEPGLWVQSPSGAITKLYGSGYPLMLLTG